VINLSIGGTANVQLKLAGMPSLSINPKEAFMILVKTPMARLASPMKNPGAG